MRLVAALCALLPVVACAQGPRRSQPYILIGNVEMWNARPFQMLDRNHIYVDGGDGGHGVVAVRIRKDQVRKAYRLLVQDAKKKGYWLAIQNPRGKHEVYDKFNSAAHQAWIKRVFHGTKDGKAGH